jgi:tetratricopeptide (TPR) repeat protein
MGEYSKALSFHEKALSIYHNALPANHPDLATCYNNLGLVYNKIGEHSEAELEPDGFFASGPVRSKSGRIIFDVNPAKKSKKIRFRPAG